MNNTNKYTCDYYELMLRRLDQLIAMRDDPGSEIENRLRRYSDRLWRDAITTTMGNEEIAYIAMSRMIEMIEQNRHLWIDSISTDPEENWVESAERCLHIFINQCNGSSRTQQGFEDRFDNGRIPNNSDGLTGNRDLPNRRRAMDTETIESAWKTTAPAVNSEEWIRMNNRRADLIDKKHLQGLSESESLELDHLQKISFNAVDQAFPMSEVDLEALRRLAARSRSETETSEE